MFNFTGSRGRSDLILLQFFFGHAFVLIELTGLEDEIADDCTLDVFWYSYFDFDFF